VQGTVERAYDKHEYLSEKTAAFEAVAREIERVLDGRGLENATQLVAPPRRMAASVGR
jgi:hypothetical protein